MFLRKAVAEKVSEAGEAPKECSDSEGLDV